MHGRVWASGTLQRNPGCSRFRSQLGSILVPEGHGKMRQRKRCRPAAAQHQPPRAASITHFLPFLWTPSHISMYGSVLFFLTAVKYT